MSTVTGQYFDVIDLTFTPEFAFAGEPISVSMKLRNKSGIRLKYLEFAIETIYPDGEYRYSIGPLMWADMEEVIGSGSTKSLSFDLTLMYGTVNYILQYLGGARSRNDWIKLMVGGWDAEAIQSKFERFDLPPTFAFVDARYNPSIGLAAARCDSSSSTTASDEGTHLLSAIGLSMGSVGLSPDLSGFSCTAVTRLTGSQTDIVRQSLAVSDYWNTTVTDAGLLDAQGGYALGNSYDVTVTFGDAYETVTRTVTVPDAFANVHMSGASTGGVRFGGFSTATENHPKFECDYPAYLYGGINGCDYSTTEVKTPFKWIDGKDIYRIVFQVTSIPMGSMATTARFTIQDMDTLIDVRGLLRRATSDSLLYPITYRAMQNTAVLAIDTWAKGNGEIKIRLGTGMEINGGYIIAEYTKQQ